MTDNYNMPPDYSFDGVIKFLTDQLQGMKQRDIEINNEKKYFLEIIEILEKQLNEQKIRKLTLNQELRIVFTQGDLNLPVQRHQRTRSDINHKAGNYLLFFDELKNNFFEYNQNSNSIEPEKQQPQQQSPKNNHQSQAQGSEFNKLKSNTSVDNFSTLDDMNNMINNDNIPQNNNEDIIQSNKTKNTNVAGKGNSNSQQRQNPNTSKNANKKMSLKSRISEEELRKFTRNKFNFRKNSQKSLVKDGKKDIQKTTKDVFLKNQNNTYTGDQNTGNYSKLKFNNFTSKTGVEITYKSSERLTDERRIIRDTGNLYTKNSFQENKSGVMNKKSIISRGGNNTYNLDNRLITAKPNQPKAKDTIQRLDQNQQDSKIATTQVWISDVQDQLEIDNGTQLPVQSQSQAVKNLTHQQNVQEQDQEQMNIDSQREFRQLKEKLNNYRNFNDNDIEISAFLKHKINNNKQSLLGVMASSDGHTGQFQHNPHTAQEILIEMDNMLSAESQLGNDSRIGMKYHKKDSKKNSPSLSIPVFLEDKFDMHKYQNQLMQSNSGKNLNVNKNFQHQLQKGGCSSTVNSNGNDQQYSSAQQQNMENSSKIATGHHNYVNVNYQNPTPTSTKDYKSVYFSNFTSSKISETKISTNEKDANSNTTGSIMNYDQLFNKIRQNYEKFELSSSNTNYHNLVNSSGVSTNIPPAKTPNFNSLINTNNKQPQRIDTNIDHNNMFYNIYNPENNNFVYPSYSNEENLIVGNSKWSSTNTKLINHLDSVRDLYFCDDKNVLVSVSEDCLVNVWDIKAIMFHSQKVIYQPLITLRDHFAPLFTVSGYTTNTQQNYVFAAGSEGIIKVWEIPHDLRVFNYNLKSSSSQVAWKAHSEPIWELNHHKIKPLMISSSPDGVKLWHTIDNSDFQKLIPGKMLTRFAYRNSKELFPDRPTSVCWSYPSDNIIVGFASTANICIFDIETGTNLEKLTFDKNNTASSLCLQPNKVIFSKNCNMIISGNEDQTIRQFDFKSNRLINTIIGHTDGVTGLCLNSDESLIVSSSHDGSMRVWDMRNFKCHQELSLGLKKFDESINNVAISENYQCLASGKIFLF